MEIKPCRFCGSKAKLYSDADGNFVYAGCRHTFGGPMMPTQKGAIRAWNIMMTKHEENERCGNCKHCKSHDDFRIVCCRDGYEFYTGVKDGCSDWEALDDT